MKTTKIVASTIAIILFYSLFTGCSKKDHITEVDPALIPSSVDFNLNHFDNVLYTKDNGLLIAGAYHLKSTLIKTNYKFEKEWTKNNYDWGNMVQGSGWGSSFYGVNIVKMFQRNDGSYICIGSIMEGGDVVWHSALVIVLNRQGEQIHKYEFQDMEVSNALQTSDGGYLLFGTSLIKLDRNFSQQWEKNLIDHITYNTQIVSTSDGGFAITGTYNGEQVFLKKIDSNGNEISIKTYKHNDSPFEETGFDLVQLSDKGFLIIGRTGKTFVPNIVNYQIIRTNAIGDTIWTKRFGDFTNEWLERFISYGNNEFVLQGSIGFPNEAQKSALFRINSDGQILDSSETEKFQMMVYSPLKFYLKIQNKDSEHVNFSRIESSNLFN